MQIRDRVKELRRVKASELRPSPKNWRTHPGAQRDALQGLLAEVGYADALLARQLEDGTLELVDGHLRAETTPDMEVPVLVLDVDEAEAEKLLATLDPLAGMAVADPEKLRALLQTMTTSSDAVSALLAMTAKEAGFAMGEVEVVEDQVPEVLPEAVTRRGDLWVLGDHRLLCGDSSDARDLDALLDGAVIHLVNTDPPYNVKVEPRGNAALLNGSGGLPSREQSKLLKSKKLPKNRDIEARDRVLKNDFLSDEEFERLLRAWFGNISRVLVPGGSFYIWGGSTNCSNYPSALASNSLFFHQAVIWVKEHPALTRRDFMSNHEWCFYGWKEGAAHRFLGPANVPDTWSIKKITPQSMIHLTEKPVELAARAIQYSSAEGENVLDLFGGSGSTLIAAEQLKRKAYIMELDPSYADVIVRRWEEYTKQEAVDAKTRKTWRQTAEERGVKIPEGD